MRYVRDVRPDLLSMSALAILLANDHAQGPRNLTTFGYFKSPLDAGSKGSSALSPD